jgi:hypothetical protein
MRFPPWREGSRFPRGRSEIPDAAVDYVARQVGVEPTEIAFYVWTGCTSRFHRTQIRHPTPPHHCRPLHSLRTKVNQRSCARGRSPRPPGVSPAPARRSVATAPRNRFRGTARARAAACRLSPRCACPIADGHPLHPYPYGSLRRERLSTGAGDRLGKAVRVRKVFGGGRSRIHLRKVLVCPFEVFAGGVSAWDSPAAPRPPRCLGYLARMPMASMRSTAGR